MNAQQTIRLAVIDDDSGFVTVLAKRTETAGWQQRQVACRDGVRVGCNGRRGRGVGIAHGSTRPADSVDPMCGLGAGFGQLNALWTDAELR